MSTTKADSKDGKFISLPSIESIKKKVDRQQVQDLLEEGHLLKSTIERETARLDEIKDELLNIQEEYQMPGFRNGPYCFSATFQEGRRSLSKEALIENGVGPEVLAASYRVGEGFWKKELKRIEE